MSNMKNHLAELEAIKSELARHRARVCQLEIDIEKADALWEYFKSENERLLEGLRRLSACCEPGTDAKCEMCHSVIVGLLSRKP